MGIYRPLVERAQGERKPSDIEPSKRVITPATAAGALRLPLAIKAAQKIVVGEKYATPWVMSLWATDGVDGVVARKFDQWFPEAGLGTSEFGQKFDVALDVLAAFVVGSALMAGPNVTKTAKVATAGVLGKEGLKAVWYNDRNNQFKEALIAGQLDVQNLAIPVDYDAKESIVEEAAGLTFATATSDTSNPYLRTLFSGLAITHSTASIVRGEQSRRSNYDPQIDDLIYQVNQGKYPN